MAIRYEYVLAGAVALSAVIIYRFGTWGFLWAALLLGLVVAYALKTEGTPEEIQVGASPSEHTYGAARRSEMLPADISLPEMNTWVAQSGPQQTFNPRTDLKSERCAQRGSQPEGADDNIGIRTTGEWTPNFYGPGPSCQNDQWLEKVGTQAYQGSLETASPELLPSTCSTAPSLCPLDTHWQAQFKNCPATWIEAPSCKIYERDDRLWHKDLNPLIQERAMLAGEIWDPYKHFHARQMFAQMLTKDLVHRKDSYMRPISDLQDSYCFNKTKKGIALADPDVPT